MGQGYLVNNNSEQAAQTNRKRTQCNQRLQAEHTYSTTLQREKLAVQRERLLLEVYIFDGGDGRHVVLTALFFSILFSEFRPADESGKIWVGLVVRDNYQTASSVHNAG